MAINEVDIRKKIESGVRNQQVISFVTYMLSSAGEKTIGMILNEILEVYGRTDLYEISYIATKELIVNAIKANLKRILFKQLHLNINNRDDYETGMNYFKTHLTAESIKNYKGRFRENGLPVTLTVYYSPNVLNIKVKNNFLLAPLEEAQIRERFKQATSFSSLFDFYAEYGELGISSSPEITMVGMLLDNSGIDRHSFSLYSSSKYNETISKLEIPLVDHYITKRKKFELEMQETGSGAEELRRSFHYTYRDYSPGDRDG